MASYPNIPIDLSTELLPSDDISIDVAADGTVRGRVNYAQTLYTAKISHVLISSTDRDTLMTFYQTNKALPVTFTYDGDTYTMRFMRHPRQIHLGGGWWSVDVSMIGTMD